MASLESLAQQKIEAELQSKIDALPSEIKAIQAQLSAKGLLRSGAMLKKVLRLCQDSITQQGEIVSNQYSWAINQALFASQPWAKHLVAEGKRSLSPLHTACIAHINKATALVGRPELSQRLANDLQSTRTTAENSISLNIDSTLAKKRRGFIRSFPFSLFRALSKPFTGGGS